MFGLGYVGTVCAACLADRGHSVVGVDTSETKVELVRNGLSPVVEPHVGDLIARSVDAGRLTAIMDVKSAVENSDMSIVCVGTPSRQNGAVDFASVEAVSTEIGQAIRGKTSRHAVVLRSTVLPGTCRTKTLPRLVAASGNAHFGFAFNPEFMREGTAVADFNAPAKTVIGVHDKYTADVLSTLYGELPGTLTFTDLETAELVKYVDNAWHALKVAFGNEVGLIAKSLRIDSEKLIDIFLADTRLNISPAYLRPRFAFGGSCLPKDLRALTYLARSVDLDLPILNHVLASNRMLIDRGVDWVLDHPAKRVAVLGISFKSNTDDVRESPYVELVERLVGKGREVRIFDPNIKPACMMGANKDYLNRYLPHIPDLIVSEIEEAVGWADVIVVTAQHPAYADGLSKVRPDQDILDFARIGLLNGAGRYEGFLW